MLKRFLISVTCALFLLPITQASAQQPQGETQYISDDLFTFLHSGPGRNYRILGSVIAGAEVQVLRTDSDSNYVEIVDDKDRTGWVDGEFVSPQKSLRELVPGLQQQLADATQNTSAQQTENETLRQQFSELQTQNSKLTKQLKTLEEQNADFSQKLDSADQTAKMQWFTRGGIVALISLILGVIVAYLPKKRRKSDTWM
ncbi:TIGR04211 family SH3 domain-containing protein [Paraglaciecola polaris]|uniref:SH3 domain protein n=1 Tax=Paraglaciecola polaris LMG 21857 TaxID=1129793 RepID=K6YGB3_9ALTE|nr:TIGR04211 family SH3 domain-containing protein [Paraglaciecola polaris]GAC31774.1 SH3 domain protein [Paraglaciecola polaris LMG 21857]|tara:strand:+ start:6148 stop:6747 length:600 start_codon:yes stop_codon:yes gene_type:complete